MKKLKLVLIAALFLAFSACDNASSQKEEEKQENSTDSLSTENGIIRDNRNPEGSYFKAEIGGVEKIFDFLGNAVKANHYDPRPEQNSSSIRMVRHTSDEKDRISVQIVGLAKNMELPISIPNDSLGVQMRFSYYYIIGENLNAKILHKPTNDFKLIVNQIKGDTLIGTFEGFFTNDALMNEDYIKVENGVFRFKLEGMSPAM